MTKIGGLPYWPASRSWPVDKTHGAMTFIAQFWFADSTDIHSSLPGDALLIFGNDSNFYEGLQLEWVGRTSDPLIDPSDILSPKWPIQPCFASLLRTFEYPEADRKSFGREFPLSEQARGGSGTKIGGIFEEYDYTIHLWSEEDLELIPSAREEHEGALRSIERLKTRGPLLCRLESLSTASKWPFLNVPQRTWRFTNDANLLMIYDAGAMAIFLSDKNELSYELSSG